MLRAEEPDRKINQGNIERSEHRQDSGQLLGLRAVGESTQHQIAYVNQPQHQGRGEANVSRRPPDAPHRPRPDRTGDKNDGTEDYAHFSRGYREHVKILPWEIFSNEEVKSGNR